MKKLGRDYWLLWSGFSVSTLGTYLSLLVINLFIYQTTKSPFMVGVFLLVRLLPAFFMGNIAGVLADKFNRKYLIITADIMRALLITSVIFLRENIYPLYFIIFGIAICDRLYQSSLGGSIPNLVKKDEIVVANSYLAGGRTIALVAGPMTGGLLISTGSYTIAFSIDALTYVFSAIVTSLTISKFHEVATQQTRKNIGILSGLKEGYGFIFARTSLFSIILLRCIDAFGSSAINIGLPIFADSLNYLTAGVCYALMFACFGVGEMIGSLYLSRRKFILTAPPEIVVGFAILFMGLFFGISLSWQNLFSALIFLLLSGLFEGITVVTYSTYLQRNPDEMRGRIVGTSETSVWTSMAVGMFFSGLLAETAAISIVVQFFGGLIVIGSVIHLIIWRKKLIQPTLKLAPEEN